MKNELFQYLLQRKEVIYIYRRRGRDRMVVGFTISAYHHKSCEFESRLGEVYLIQHNANKFVSDLLQVDGFPGYSAFLHQ